MPVQALTMMQDVIHHSNQPVFSSLERCWVRVVRLITGCYKWGFIFISYNEDIVFYRVNSRIWHGPRSFDVLSWTRLVALPNWSYPFENTPRSFKRRKFEENRTFEMLPVDGRIKVWFCQQIFCNLLKIAKYNNNYKTIPGSDGCCEMDKFWLVHS